MKKYQSYNLFASNLDEKIMNQITEILNSTVAINQKVVIMPDTHFGQSGPIGLTMTYDDKISPSLIGSDIGCGVSLFKLTLDQKLDLKALKENIINLPIRTRKLTDLEKIMPEKNPFLLEMTEEKYLYILETLGTLGDGNHFVEIYFKKDYTYYVAIHSGSRALGAFVYDYFKKKTVKTEENTYLNYLEEDNLLNYIELTNITNKFASLNRYKIMKSLTNIIDLDSSFELIIDAPHNFVDTEMKIIRKGAQKALPNSKIIIPINMRDGIILANTVNEPKILEKWNYSAPHGAGRVKSRTLARKEIPLNIFQQQMKGIVSRTVDSRRLDEAPDAYKTMDYILEEISEIIKDYQILKPIFNHKG